MTHCPHCGCDTLVTVLPGDDPTVHCTNDECGGYFATMRLSQFAALTDLEARKPGRTSLASLDAGQAAHEANVDDMMAKIEARKATRQSNERLFG